MPLNALDVLRCAVRIKTAENKDHVNVYELITMSAYGYANEDLLDAVAGFFDDVYTTLNAVMYTPWVPYDLKVDVVDVVGGIKTITQNIGTISWGDTFAPGAGSDPLPLHDAAVLLCRTSIGRVLGRKFIGGFTENDWVGDKWSPTALAALAAFGGALLTGFGTPPNNFVAGVLSQAVGHVGTFYPFYEVDISPEPGVQRRRKVSRGS